MRPVDGVVELIQAMTDALMRNDEGDMDSPAWENASRLEPLRAQLRLLSRRGTDQGAASATPRSGKFEGIPAS